MSADELRPALGPKAAPLPMKTVYVSFSAEINPSTTEHLIAVLAKQANDRVEHVYVLLSTPGGGVMNGLNVYNFMRAMPYKITTHNVGNIDSIGNAIFLAGVERIACPHSTFMFHGVGFDVAAKQRVDEKACRELLDGILSDQRRIGSILKERTRLNDGETDDLFREARTKDATFALEKGIVHRVADVNVPPGAPVVSLVFQR